MAEIIKDRVFYRPWNGEDFQSWKVLISSPESGLLTQFVFELPTEEELKGWDRAKLGEFVAFTSAVGACIGFKEGVLVGSISNAADVHPDLGDIKKLVERNDPTARAAAHARRISEEDELCTVVDWTRSSFSFKPGNEPKEG